MRSLSFIIVGLFCLNLYAQRDIPLMVETDCMGCHTGVINAPRIVGQDKDFLEFELFNFRDFVRDHEIMNQSMEGFTDKEVKEIAAYLSSLSICDAPVEVEKHPDADVNKGEKIFNNSCFNCHKKDTSGIGPILHGQKTGYMEEAIKSFQSTWYEPRPSRINMRKYTDMLSEQDIKDVAAYLNEQQLCKKRAQ